MQRIGFVVNPIAGMGGRVGLKGTDGKVEEARERGAEPRAPDRAREALASIAERAPDLEVLTYGDPMGASLVREARVDPVVVGRPESDRTGAEDTRAAVRAVLSYRPDGDGSGTSDSDESGADAGGVDLVVFVGGDGTAADVAETVAAEGGETPILGVPAGVKIYSSVFAVRPDAVGRIVADHERVEAREVNDVDEDSYREGEVHTELKAVVDVPVADEVQASKQLGGGSVEALAAGVAEDARSDLGATYVLGPGSTVGEIKRELGFEGSPLGVDVWRDGEVLVRDGGAAEIEAALGDRNVIVVSPIGGQGFVFGRGNQQLSPAVIRRSEVAVVASKPKLDTIGELRVDTGDPDLDERLRGWRKVRVGRFEHRLVRVA